MNSAEHINLAPGFLLTKPYIRFGQQCAPCCCYRRQAATKLDLPLPLFLFLGLFVSGASDGGRSGTVQRLRDVSKEKEGKREYNTPFVYSGLAPHPSPPP